MANVNIKFNNKDYLLSCDDGKEESLKKLTKFLDKKYSELKDKLGNIGENKLLLITTIHPTRSRPGSRGNVCTYTRDNPNVEFV